MSRNLLVRIAVAVPAIAVTVAVLWLGGWVLATALAVLGVLGTREVYDLARRGDIEPFDRLSRRRIRREREHRQCPVLEGQR